MGSSQLSHFKAPAEETIQPDKLYVLKKIPIKGVKQKLQLAAVMEAKIMSSLKHPHIITYHTSFVEGEYVYILMEYAQNGDLHKYIETQKQKEKYISEANLWSFSF